jgi:hypothetical protein
MTSGITALLIALDLLATIPIFQDRPEGHGIFDYEHFHLYRRPDLFHI